MMNIRGIFLVIVGMLPLLGHAQQVTFDYDASGNRIGRMLATNSRGATASNSMQLFTAAPNPVSDFLQITCEDQSGFSGEYRYTLQSVYGNTELSDISHTAVCQLDVSGLSKGVYILNIKYKEGEQSIKIIKK